MHENNLGYIQYKEIWIIDSKFCFPYKINLACLRHCVKLLWDRDPHTIQLTLISDSTRKQ